VPLKWFIVVVVASMVCAFLFGRWASSPPVEIRSAGIQPGATIPTFVARHVDGARDVTVASSGDAATLLYVLSPTCSWCDANYDNIVTLATAVPHQVLGVAPSLAGLAEHLDAHPLPFDVVVVDSPPPALDLRVTPQLALLGPEGYVERVWVGAWSGDTLSAIENAFGVQLPGLALADTPSALPPGSVLPPPCYDDDGLISSEGAIVVIGGTRSRCHDGAWVPLTNQDGL